MLAKKAAPDLKKRQKPQLKSPARENIDKSNKLTDSMDDIKVGNIVDRMIEGCWFPAEVMNIKRHLLSLRYLDDGNVEEMVPLDEVRPSHADKTDIQLKNDTLLKPLLGLVEDDSEIRRAHQPTVIVHKDMDTGS